MNIDMTLPHVVATLSFQTSRRLAEVGFLFVVLAGVWLVAAQFPRLKLGSTMTIIPGIALAIAGVLLIVATHWGHLV